jgi:hypothetical protein
MRVCQFRHFGTVKMFQHGYAEQAASSSLTNQWRCVKQEELPVAFRHPNLQENSLKSESHE